MLRKKNIFFSGIIFLVVIVFAPSCWAVTLLTQEEALRIVFPDADKVISETKTISETQFENVKKVLGGILVHYPKGLRAEDIAAQRDFVFHFSLKGDQKTGVAIILEEPGKWGPITFLVALDLKGTISRVVVLSYKEVRGRPIAGSSFLSQFIGKTSKDALIVRQDVTGISGATISSNAAAFTVKKAIALYEELYLI